MIAAGIYVLKVILCSGFLYLYYFLALRNRPFHQWNRFYLLLSVICSLIIPFLEFTIGNNSQPGNQTIQLLQVVESPHVFFEEINQNQHTETNPDYWIALLYFGISAFLLSRLIYGLAGIIRIIRSHSIQQIKGVNFIPTNVEGTPFSFFNYIFWNKAIDLYSPTGQQMLHHELVHVKQKHTLDKIFLQFILIIFWCNPFFWLFRKELQMVNEFIADEKAVAGEGKQALAAMILHAASPHHFNQLINPFFQTSIKRRLSMIARINNPRLSYAGRLTVLPLLALIIFGFSIRTKKSGITANLKKPFTVVIDAGHGYVGNSPSGARTNNAVEDDLVLDIARKISLINSDPNLKIILSRQGKDQVDLKGRVESATINNANLFISLHLNADDKNKDRNGFEIYVPRNSSFNAQSEKFGSVLQHELEKLYATKKDLSKSPSNIYVLDKNSCPAVLIELGNIQNGNDANYISNEKNRGLIAEKFLTAIANFAQHTEDLSALQITNRIRTLTFDESDSLKLEYVNGRRETLSRGDAIKRFGNEINVEGTVIQQSKNKRSSP